ncbi:MAG: molecular chaperone HtpG [Gammaproteobacteria bacterium RIFCSPHIGHO2_12_FULL_43_28]|nr:MAG: molecular chaperone HtpG [Gammaproteobacteria bacterium RIFCSPHIGHO2_12_FULL_43_28]
MMANAQAETLHFQAEVKQLMDIVVHSLYSNKEIFLRELISNASDAIDKLRFEALSDSALYESDSSLQIHVSYDEKARTITISDNGIGLTREEAMSHLGTIAKSGTREFLSHLTGDQKKDAHLIGQFGVGFYSAFMVADKITVNSRRAGMTKEHGVCWESKGDGEYVVTNIEKAARGTDVILHLKAGEDEFLSDWRLRSIITKYADHITVPILMKAMNEEGKLGESWETVNRALALWTQPKSIITDEQYQTFYKHIAHAFNEPLAWTHHKVEGSHIDYTSILYLPKEAPFDLWQRDAQHGLKLYVQRVFIMDKVEQFLPNYLRFVSGVLDTTALPLNISREILQDHPSIAKLRSALVRHVLDLLERLQKDEPEKFALFWQAFGNVLKEGVVEDFANRDRLATLFRFASTHSDSNEQTVSLSDYVKRMKPKQKNIYYITAENTNAAKSSPHLEIFRKNNIEVVLLTDRIDEWVVGHLPQFDGKALQSVAKGDLQLDELIDEAELKSQEQTEKKVKETLDPLLTKIEKALGNKIKSVRLSHRLTDSPACLVRDQSALGPQMERLMKAAGQDVLEVKPILELNPAHPIVNSLSHEQNEERLKEWTELLYEQALLAEGSQLQDPAYFVKRVNKLWMEIVDKRG